MTPRLHTLCRTVFLGVLGLGLSVGSSVGGSVAHAAGGSTITEAPLAALPSRLLPRVFSGERPEEPQESVRPLGAGAPEDPSLPGQDAPVGTAAEGPRAPQNGEPALRLYYLGTLGLPETSLERIARDLAKLGLPYTIRGLPWKTVSVDAERTDVARRETTLEDLTEPFNREKTPVYVDPRPFRALEAALKNQGFSGALPLPLWFVTLEGDAPETEVLPGDLSPLCALGELLARTESPKLRETLRADLRERLAASADEADEADAAWDELLVCADFSPDVRPVEPVRKDAARWDGNRGRD